MSLAYLGFHCGIRWMTLWQTCDAIDVVLASLFLSLNIFLTFFWCFSQNTQKVSAQLLLDHPICPQSHIEYFYCIKKVKLLLEGFSILSMPNCNYSKNINSSKIFSKDFKVPWKLSRPIFCYGYNLGQRVYCRNPPISKNHLSLKLKISYLNGLHG